MKSRFNGLILIVIGGVALAYNLGYLRFDLGHLFRTWWPVIPIVVGAGFFFSSNNRKKTSTSNMVIDTRSSFAVCGLPRLVGFLSGRGGTVARRAGSHHRPHRQQ